MGGLADYLDNKMTTKEPIIEVENLKRNFIVGKNKIRAIRGMNLFVNSQDFIIVFGPSGCGKTTFLNIISGIDKPTRGTVKIRGKNIFKLDEEARSILRAKKIGMVHQTPYWIKSLNVLENVALPLVLRGEYENDALDKASKTMSSLNISSLSNQLPSQLSGGEQQKIGIARALVTDPWIILADEPTGNLDSQAADEIMSVLKNLNAEFGRTIVLITHNDEYWDLGTRRIEMKDGQIIKDTDHKNKR